MALSRSDIEAVADYQTTSVDVPEWGGVVRLRTLSQENLEEYEIEFGNRDYSSDPEAIRGLQVALVAYSLCDDDGCLLFNPSVPGDMAILKAKSPVVISRLFDVVSDLNHLNQGSQDDLKKKSDSSELDDSDIGLPLLSE